MTTKEWTQIEKRFRDEFTWEYQRTHYERFFREALAFLKSEIEAAEERATHKGFEEGLKAMKIIKENQ